MEQTSIHLKCQLISLKGLFKSIVQSFSDSLNGLEKERTRKFHNSPVSQLDNPKIGIEKEPKHPITTKCDGVTTQELKSHSNKNDAWISLNRKVYDITDYIRRHPGGSTIMKGVGTEATVLFNKYHHWVNYDFILKSRYIGPLID